MEESNELLLVQSYINILRKEKDDKATNRAETYKTIKRSYHPLDQHRGLIPTTDYYLCYYSLIRKIWILLLIQFIVRTLSCPCLLSPCREVTLTCTTCTRIRHINFPHSNHASKEGAPIFRFCRPQVSLSDYHILVGCTALMTFGIGISLIYIVPPTRTVFRIFCQILYFQSNAIEFHLMIMK